MIYRLALWSLLLIIATGVLPAASAAPANSESSAFGVSSHIGSTFPRLDGMQVAYDALAQSGAGWTREEFQWGQIEERRGKWDWSYMDRTVDGLTSRGINIIGVLNPGVNWASPSTADDGQHPRVGSFYPPDPALFAEFASQVVSRYKDRVHYWQIWNEPDNPVFWRPAPNPAAYATLLRNAYPAIKAADPTAQVLSAGIVSPEPASTFLQTIADNGAWDSFDIIALHPYTDPKSPEDGVIGDVGIGAVKTLAERLGPKPIWVTEFGWSVTASDRTGNVAFDPETQANYIVRGSAMLRAAGAEKVILYRFKDMQLRSGQVFNGYGLLGYGNGPADYSQARPSLQAFRTLNQVVGARAARETLSLNPQQISFDFDQVGSWRPYPSGAGSLSQSSSQIYRGAGAAEVHYNFTSGGNDYVALTPNAKITLPSETSRVGIWVYGDGSNFDLKVQIRDSQGEVLQYRLGKIGAPGWQFLNASITGAVESGNRIRSVNGRLDGELSLEAIVVDDDPDSRTGSGVIYLDDLTAISGAELYGIRFAGDGTQVIDMLWAPDGGQASLATADAQVTVISRDGASSTQAASNGTVTLDLGPSPIYLVHTPGTATPTPTPSSSSGTDGPCRLFPETGFSVCGRLLSYWQENGGLEVFGYPIGPQQETVSDGNTVQAQAFERNRLELAPANAKPYDVLLGRLGAEALQRQNRNWEDFDKLSAAPDGCLYMAETGHAICEPFLSYFRSHGLEFDGKSGFSLAENIALFGLPLSEPMSETLESGSYTVQYFERARFESHPENPAAYQVLLGLLGVELSQ